MSESPDSPPDRMPPAPLRRVDWLALAPWLLVLRSTGVAIGWPLVIGAAGMLVLGPWTPLRGEPIERIEGLASLPALLMTPEARSAAVLWRLALAYVGWLAFGLAIADHAARRLTESPGSELVESLRRAGARLPRVATALAVVAAPVLAIAVATWLFGLTLRVPVLSAVTAPLWGLFAALGGLPAVVAIAIVTLGAPLLVAAIVADDADGFDAVSRLFAYTTQRPGVLVACLALAWIGLALGGAILEWALESAVAFTGGLTAPPNGEWAQWLASASIQAFTLAARGFYPAYVFTAGVATYLVMRHAVDGQPLDEMASPAAAQPSAEA